MHIQRIVSHIVLIGMLLFPTLALSYEILPVKNGATITGTIRFTGTPPPPRIFTVQKNPEICGQERSLVKVDATNGLLKGAVIIIEGIQQGKPFVEQIFKADLPGKGEFFHSGGDSSSLDVRLQHCNFGPFTGVLPIQNPVHFANRDDIKHTLHTYVGLGEKSNILRTIHNRGIQAHTDIERQFTEKSMKEGRVVVLTCDRHEFMENWLYVVDTPYYAISNTEGFFSIDKIPPGHYTLRVWHPVLGTKQQDIVLESNGELDLVVELEK